MKKTLIAMYSGLHVQLNLKKIKIVIIKLKNKILIKIKKIKNKLRFISIHKTPNLLNTLKKYSENHPIKLASHLHPSNSVRIPIIIVLIIIKCIDYWLWCKYIINVVSIIHNLYLILITFIFFNYFSAFKIYYYFCILDIVYTYINICEKEA